MDGIVHQCQLTLTVDSSCLLHYVLLSMFLREPAHSVNRDRPCPVRSWLALAYEDVPGILPAQGPQLGCRQGGLPVGERTEAAVHQVNRREPSQDQGTECMSVRRKP